MTLICTCGAPLPPPGGNGHLRKFCSVACREESYRVRRRSLERYVYDPAKARAYYLANREKKLAEGRAWQEANPEKLAVIRARGNDKLWVRTRIQAADIISIFRKIPEDSRKEYAEWLFLLAQQCPHTAGILGHAKVVVWLSRYIDTEASL